MITKRKKISFAKITPPHYTGILPRKRLFKRLDQLRKRPVIWIAGPPGAGKTILVSSYLEARRVPFLWYQVDSGDADAATFFYYLGLAARSISRGKEKPLPLLTPEYVPGLATFARRYFEKLYERFKAPSTIVFDNYHEVATDSPFHEIMRNGLEVIPEGMNVIFISRTQPPPSLARLRANQSIELVGRDELQLSAEESLGMIRLKLNGQGSRELAEAITGRVKGWAAGLVLLIGEMKTGKLDDLKTVEIGTVFDYLGTEILEKLDSEARNFLLKTSVLPDMNVCMAERLTGLKNAERILSSLHHQSYFIEKRFHADPVYQYHPLFREFLQFSVKKLYQPDELKQTQGKAAEILEEAGNTEDAVALLLRTSDWEAMIRLLMKKAPDFLKQGRLQVVEEWIKALPRKVMEASPWMLYYLGICRAPFDPDEARNHFENAFDLFQKKQDPIGASLCCSGIIDVTAVALEKLRVLDRWVPILAGLIRSHEASFPEAIRARLTCSMYSGLYHFDQNDSELAVWGERALKLVQERIDINLKMQILGVRIVDKLRRAEFTQAALTIDTFHQINRSPDVSPLFTLYSYFMEAVYYFLTGSDERCFLIVNEGLKLAEISGIHLLDTMLLGHAVLAVLNLHDLKKAEELLEKIASRSDRGRGFERSFYHFLKANIAYRRGDLTEAATHSEIAFELSINHIQDNHVSAHGYLLNAWVWHELKNDEKASRSLEKSLKIVRLGGYAAHHYACLLTEAWFAFDRGDEEAGEQLLCKGLSLGREKGIFTTYPGNPKMMSELCAKALEAGIEAEYVRELIKKRQIVLEKPPVDVAEWSWPVKIFTLGLFSIVKEGGPIGFSKKAPQVPLALLKILIALGGCDVSEGQLADTLWPGADGDAAHQVLAITLHRLRKLLGSEEAISLVHGRLTLDMRYCYVDAWAFERILGKADAFLKSGNPQPAVRLIERAIVLYQGAFLGNDPIAPVLILRERLRSKYLKYIGELGCLYNKNGEFQKGVETFSRGIEVEPLAEEFYRNLMTCYQNLGRPSEAISVYRRLKNTLFTSLGVGPSAETESLYKRLLS